ncbi:MAG: hypothetical protein EAY81_10635, partial [Bacteroidetes bacterium]
MINLITPILNAFCNVIQKKQPLFKGLLCSFMLLGMVLDSNAQTTNFFGTSGTISGSVWNTSSGGPFTNALVTTGGTIMTFNSSGSATGATVSSIVGMNFNAPITWSAGGTIGAASTTITINVATSVLQDFGGSQAFSTSASAAFIKSGNGALGWAGGTFGGGLTLSAGALVLRGVNGLGSGAVNLNGGTLCANANRSISNPTSITVGGDIQFGEIPANVSLASNTATITLADNIALGSTNRIFTLGNAATHTFSGVISGTAGITFSANANGASGTFALTTGNTYSGKTVLSGGIVSGSGESIFGSNPASFTADQITFNGGTFSASGNVNFSSNRGITLGASGANINTNANTVTLTNITTGTGGITKTGSGTLTLAGLHTYTGSTTISAGTLQLSGSGNNYPSSSALSLAASTNFDLNGLSTTIGSLAGLGGTVTSTATGTLTLTAGGDNTSTSFAGIIQNGTATSVALTKEGSGTLILTGQSTNTGNTIVNAGTLRLNRTGGTTIPVTQSVNVNNTATLQVSSNQSLVNVVLASGTTLTVDGSTTLTITGTLTVNTGATISGSGSIAYSGGAIIYNGSGNLTAGVEWPTSSVPGSVTINSGATVTLGSTRTTTTTLTVDGTLNASTFSITGTGTVNINGTFITSNLDGFTGTGASFTGATPTLGPSSIIEYAASSGTQIITTSPSYVNLTISGGGTKTAASSLSISGTLTISGTAMLDAGNSTIGGTGTNLTMTGSSTLKLGGTGTRPSMTGTYTLANTSTIEFTNTAGTQQDIRLAPTYGNVNISGTNVGLSSASSVLTLQSGSTFTVKNGATFNVINTNGFSGANNTAIDNTNSPIITLETNSTLNYSGSSSQTISTRADYKKLTFSGGNIKTLTSSITVDEDINLATANDIVAIGSNTLTVNGTISGLGFLRGSATSNLTIGGTSSNTLNLDQSTLGTSNLLNNLTLSGSGTTTLGSALNINGGVTPGTVSVTGTATLASAGFLTLKSDANGTARIGEITGATVSGNVNIERFMQGGSGRRGWRTMSSPVSGFTFNDMIDDVLITGPGGTSNGFDGSGTSTSILTYQENTSGTRGWKNITLASTLNPGMGMLTFFRGDRTQTSSITNSATVPNNVTADYTGTINQGTLSAINLSYTNTGVAADDGWNLLGNPYPSEINYNAVNKTGSVSTTYWVWDAGTGNYVNRLATEHIAIGQGFFVQVSGASQTITFEENDKVTTNPTSYFKTQQVPFVVKMYQDSSKYDIAWLSFSALSSNNFVFNEDARKLKNNQINMGFVTPDSQLVQRNVVPQLHNNAADTFVLFVQSASSGIYFLHFEGLQAFPSTKQVLLLDLYNQHITNIRANPTYSYAINTSNGGTFGNRFRLIVGDMQPLPVQLLSFNGKRNENTNELSWEVTAEKNMLGYEIQHAFDGEHFTSIDLVYAQNKPTKHTYTYQDKGQGGLSYYRLKLIDYQNTKHTYSNVVVLSASGINNQVLVSPNPAHNYL